MNLTKTKILTLAILQGITSVNLAHAEVDESPYVTPKRDCITEGMVNPPGKNFRFLYNHDCRVVYALPPATLPQEIRGAGVDLEQCSEIKSLRDRIRSYNDLAAAEAAQVAKLQASLEKAGEAQEKRINQKIEDKLKNVEKYENAAKERRAFVQATYGEITGAKFVVTLKDEVTNDDLNDLRVHNWATLNRRRTVIEKNPDGTIKSENVVIDLSSLRVLTPTESYYSFSSKVPKDAAVNGGILSVQFPSLQVLKQKDDQTGVIHVRANGGASAEVNMSLTAVCGHVKPGPEGRPALDEKLDPLFVVNRTFAVHKKVGEGYTAKLSVSKVVDEIVRRVTADTNRGFNKVDTFRANIDAQLGEYMEFKWDSGYKERQQDFQSILEIKRQVATKMIDDYLEKLVAAGIVTKVEIPPTEAAKGGFSDETRTGQRCWSNSSWGGLKRDSGCANFNYVVKVWNDGITDEDKRRSLTLSGETTESMVANTTIPFYYSTSFTNGK